MCNLQTQNTWNDYIIIPTDHALYAWVLTQRLNEILSIERSRKLDAVCINWRVTNVDAEWEINLEKVKEWKAEQIVSMLFMVHPHIVTILYSY